MKTFTGKLEQRLFRTDRCAVNQTVSTAEVHLRPCSKHLDAAFRSNMSKTKNPNQSFILKRPHEAYLSKPARSAFQMFEKMLQPLFTVKLRKCLQTKRDDYLFHISFNKCFLLLFACFQPSLLQQISKAVLSALTCGSVQHFSGNPVVLNFYMSL